jgi:hypothetical protein
MRFKVNKTKVTNKSIISQSYVEGRGQSFTQLIALFIVSNNEQIFRTNLNLIFD